MIRISSFSFLSWAIGRTWSTKLETSKYNTTVSMTIACKTPHVICLSTSMDCRMENGRSAGGAGLNHGKGLAWPPASLRNPQLFLVLFINHTSPIFTMLSLRAFSRAAPRFTRSVARTSLRPAILPKTSFVQPWKQVAKPAYASFSTTSVFREPAAEGKLIVIGRSDGIVMIPGVSGSGLRRKLLIIRCLLDRRCGADREARRGAQAREGLWCRGCP